MRYKRLKLCAVILLGFGLTGIQAQESINAAGGDATGTGGSASYSVGQLVYTTNTGTNGSASHGVQQAYEISEITEVNDVIGINLSVSAFPNPTTDYLNLEVDNNNGSSVKYQLFNISGKLLESKSFETMQTKIYMKNFAPAVYFLKVIENNKEIKTFKIIKN